MTKNNIKIIAKSISILWIFLWLSISTSPHDLENINFNNFLNLINVIRISVPLILSIIILIALIYVLYSKTFKLKYRFNITKIYFISFILYFSLQYVGLYSEVNFFNNELINFELHYYFLLNLSLGSLGALLFFKILDLKSNQSSHLMTLSIMILSVACFFSLIKLFQNYSISDHIYLYNSVSLDDKLFDQTYPRVTGVARSLSLIAILLFLSNFFIKKNKFLLSIEFLFFVLLTMIVWGIQSRGAILCLYISLFFLLFIIKNSIKSKIFKILIFIILPIFIFETYKNFLIEGSFFGIIPLIKNTDKLDNKAAFSNKLAINRFNTKQGSSGRFQLWMKSLNKYEKNRFFGYGPQADRLLISTRLAQQYGNNVSNGFIYAFLCSGYLGVFSFIILNLLFYYSLLIIVFKKKIFQRKKNFIEKLSTTYLIFFCLRIVFENSYAVFSIDFLITSLSSFIVINYLQKTT
tara:strand:- start:2540 stop:3934 length:1395 start_codon:yes stop_codon:yes gene_type:complete